MHEFKSIQNCTLLQINWDVKAWEAPQKVRWSYQEARSSSHESVSNAGVLYVCLHVYREASGSKKDNIWDNGHYMMVAFGNLRSIKWASLNVKLVTMSKLVLYSATGSGTFSLTFSFCWLVRIHCFRQWGKQEMALAVLYRGECSIKITFFI